MTSTEFAAALADVCLTDYTAGKRTHLVRMCTVVCLLCTALLLTACDGGSGGGGQAAPDERQLVSGLEFADQKLADCVQGAADSAGWIYADEIEAIECINFGIKSLGGLELFAGLPDVSLRRLDLGVLDPAVTDLGPLADLQSLASLRLTGHSAVDIGPLASLSGLRELELAGVIQFSDAGGCAGAAISRIDSFSPLVELAELQVLKLYGCFMAEDYSVINSLEALEELHLTYNFTLTELPALDNLSQLRVLNLSSSTYLGSIDAISSLTGLQYLVLPGDLSWGGGLEPLAGLANLRDLVIEDSVTIVDWGTLAGLTSLESLVLTWRELDFEPRGSLADLSPLVSLQKLTRLRLEHQRISDIGPLAALPGLVELSLRDNQVSDLTPLAGLDSVTTLDLYANPILELDPLVGMPALESLTVPYSVSCPEVNDFATARPDVLLSRPEGPCPP